MRQSWFHLAALGVFVLIGFAWGLVRCGVLGEMPTRIPKNSAELDVLPPEELPKEGVPGYPRRYFDGTGTVRGRLIEPGDGTPREGATVRAAAKPELRVQTDAEGRFELAGIPAGLDAALRIEIPGGAIHGISTLALRPGATVDLGTVALGGRSRVTGRVTSVAGTPLPGAVVTLHEPHLLDLRVERPADLPLFRRPPALHRAVTDAEGRYAIPDVTRGELVAVVRAAGYVPVREGVTAGRPEVVHDAVLDAAVEVRGVVLDPAGRPIGNAGVVLLSSLRDGAALLTARYAATDAKGRFRFTTVWRPDERLVVFAGTTLYTWDDRLADGMIVRLR